MTEHEIVENLEYLRLKKHEEFSKLFLSVLESAKDTGEPTASEWSKLSLAQGILEGLRMAQNLVLNIPLD